MKHDNRSINWIIFINNWYYYLGGLYQRGLIMDEEKDIELTDEEIEVIAKIIAEEGGIL